LDSGGTITCNELIAKTNGTIGNFSINSNGLTGGNITCNRLVANNYGSIAGFTITKTTLPDIKDADGNDITCSYLNGDRIEIASYEGYVKFKSSYTNEVGRIG
jgi:hypothetical protein